jgi:adenylate cyclase
MAIPDASPAAMRTATRLRFASHVLDLDRGCLLLGGNEVPLRPKTFAVLRFLVENSGRLVSKDELFEAVWPGIAVTDDALVQSIGELRRAFGADGARLIRTVPRRGYRFEAAVATETPAAGDTPDPAASVQLNHRLLRRGVRAPHWTAAARKPQRALAVIAVTTLLAAGTIWTVSQLGSRSDPDSGGIKISAVSTKPVIAILPFRNESEAGRDYFADGLAQDLIAALGRFSELTVMSWNAVRPYRSKTASPKEIAGRLAARYQVEASIRQAEDRVRVTAQLVDAEGRVLWSARFDEALPDLFTLQDKITAQIAQALAIRVAQIEQGRISTKPTESLEAYDCVLRARPALLHPARASIVEARTLLRRAIQLDPNYAAAYAALAETYHIAVAMGWAESPTEFLDRAEELANKALGIDGSEVRAHIVLGRIDLFHHRYEQAQAQLERAIAINPNDAGALAGRGNLLMWLGQTDAAIDSLEQARRIDPELNPIDRFALSLAYFLKRRCDAAIDQAELNLRETASANFSRIVLAAAYAEDDRAEDAARVAATVHTLDPTFDAREFGTKFLSPNDLEHLRDGLRKAGLF